MATNWRAGLQRSRLDRRQDYNKDIWLEGRMSTKQRLEGWITVRQLAGGQDYNEDNWLEGRIAMKTTTWRSGLQQT